MSFLTELRIPHSGSVENAKLMSWLVAEGAAYRAGQALYEIETDKTLMEVEAETDGVLARREAAEGDERKVGERVGWCAPAGASAEGIAAALKALDASSANAAGAELAPTPPASSSQAAGPESGGKLSPLVRRLAAEHQVDLARVAGTGPGGKITGDDVLRAAKSAGDAAPSIPGYEDVPVKVVPNSSRRKAIARRLLDSVRNSALLTADMQIDLGAVFTAREHLNATRQSRGEAPVSVLAYVAQALCKVLRMRPDFNATFTDSHTMLWQAVHLGVAVDCPEGLVVPVIRDADRLGVEQIDAAVRGLAQRARDNQLKSDELEGATFTLSNPGSLGPVLRAEAVLNPPQVALLGLPALLRTPVAVEGPEGQWTVVVRPVVRPSLTFDHRALDGGQAIGFLVDLKRLLEQQAGQA